MNSKELLRDSSSLFSIAHEIIIHPINMKRFHTHEHFEILYLCQSHRNLYTPGSLFVMDDNALALIPPGFSHRTESPKNVPQERILINFKYDFISDIANALDIDVLNCFSQTFPLKKCTQEQLRIIKNIFERLISINATTNPSKTSMLQLLLCQLLIECSHLDVAYPTSITAVPNRMLDVVNYIEQNYFEEISLDILSKKFNIDKYSISRNFTNYTSQSFNKFLIDTRLKYASKMILDTRLSILEIAIKTGFNNVSHFSSCFKSKFGVSPLHYRKQGATHKTPNM